MALCGFSFKAWRFDLRCGSANISPNAGYPEAALAGILDVQFGGDHDYFGKIVTKPVIGQNPRPLNKGDLVKTIHINRAVEITMLVLVISSLIISDLSNGGQGVESLSSSLCSYVSAFK